MSEKKLKKTNGNAVNVLELRIEKVDFMALFQVIFGQPRTYT